MKHKFYDVKIRKSVEISEDKVTKKKISLKSGQVRHVLKAKTEDGRNLTRFVSQADWDKITAPEE